MKTITTNELNTVYGGASKKADADVTAQITALKSSLSDLGANKDKSSSDTLLPLIMCMAMQNKQQGPTVVAAGAPAAPVVAGGPVVNISNRVGHHRWG